MAILGKDDASIDLERNLELARYRVELTALVSDSEDGGLDLTDYLISTEFQYLYNLHVFPYIIFDLILPKSIHLQIQREKSTVLFLLNIYN